VCSHGELNPELGGESDYRSFVDALRRHGMGHILDFVPNHMSATPTTHGGSMCSKTAPTRPIRSTLISIAAPQVELANKVLLPILSQQYGAVLEAGELQLEHVDGGFVLRYFDQVLPIGPKTAIPILTHRLDELRLALSATKRRWTTTKVLSPIGADASQTAKNRTR